MAKKTVAFQTLGCKLNFSESSTISRMMREEGYEVVETKEKADVYVIHTCMVTGPAEKKCRAAIRQAKRRNPGATVAVIGCLAQLRADEVLSMPEADIVLGNYNKYELSGFLKQFEENGHKINAVSGSWKDPYYHPAYSGGDRTRTFLKIQDGCDYFCSYCTIPLARGRSRSLSIGETLTLAQEAIDGGAKEIVLTGVNIGDFGKPAGEKLLDLLQGMEKYSDADRIRISSIEPDLLDEEIIDFVAKSKKFAPHFHIPLQAGSDKVLQAMNRRYDTTLFTEKITLIRKHMPFACIAVDVITGFPGETENDFLEGKKYLADMDLSYLHVFTYSERPDTKAVQMQAKLSPAVKKQRSEVLHELSEIKKIRFYEQNRGRTVTVLFEADHHDGYMYGFSENYIRVKTLYDNTLVNKLVTVGLTETDQVGNYLFNCNRHEPR
ncbi:MAG: tRNA (N(6)-L-threonylcarbamoyladenosine(37)-C(2))-methylthiotransferase MtaB [Bacteroidetes bacterium]|nr:tRNA (N(6)-L-threonylcarbamoyladenosine(37)-C(2))-methylthiotransferase MtaB [Bacteroidota bacterium]